MEMAVPGAGACGRLQDDLVDAGLVEALQGHVVFFFVVSYPDDRPVPSEVVSKSTSPDDVGAVAEVLPMRLTLERFRTIEVVGSRQTSCRAQLNGCCKEQGYSEQNARRYP